MFISQNYYVGYRDVNALEEITNTSLLAFLENTSGKHSALTGNSITKEHTWMLISWKVKALKRAKFNDMIRVETWSKKIDKFYAFRDFKVYDSNEEVIAVVTSKWIYLDTIKGKIIKVPEKLEKSYETEPVSAFSTEEDFFTPLKDPKEYISNINFKITKNMIDQNHHLHNIYYMDIAKEALPENFSFDKELDNFEILYKKEIKYGQEVKAFYSFINNKHIVTIKSDDEKTLHAIIELY